MAVWQYDVALVPRAGVIHHLGLIPDTLPGFRAVWHPQQEPEQELPDYWAVGERPEALAAEISTILPPCRSWSDNALMFGEEQGHKLELWRGKSMTFRFDLRNPDLEILRAVVSFAQAHGLLWVSDTLGRPIAPDFQEVLRDIQASDAYRFCKDPLAFLKSLPKDAKINAPPLEATPGERLSSSRSPLAERPSAESKLATPYMKLSAIVASLIAALCIIGCSKEGSSSGKSKRLVPATAAEITSSPEYKLEHTTKAGIQLYVRELPPGIAKTIAFDGPDHEFLQDSEESPGYFLVMIRGGEIIDTKAAAAGALKAEETGEIMGFIVKRSRKMEEMLKEATKK